MGHPYRLPPILALTALLAACASFKEYSNGGERNVVVYTETHGSTFRSVEPSIDIYDASSGCTQNAEYPYLGTVVLKQGRSELSLPTNKAALVVANFKMRAFATSSSITQRAIFTPKAGRKYQLDLLYADDMYDVILKEIDSKTRASKKLAIVRYLDCKR